MCSEWTRLINRQISKKDSTPWKPGKDSVVCSEHFIEGKPTTAYPKPTLKLGYDRSLVVLDSKKTHESTVVQADGTESDAVADVSDIHGVELVQQQTSHMDCDDEENWLSAALEKDHSSACLIDLTSGNDTAD